MSAPAPARVLAAMALVAATATAALVPATDAHATSVTGPEADPDCLRVLDGIDLQTATVLELQAALDAGTLTSVELVQRYLERIAAFDGPVELPALDAETADEPEAFPPFLNSIRVLAPDALEQAAALDAERAAGTVRGPLHGLAVLLKDNVGTTDVPTTAGSIALADNIPTAEAFLTTQLREAGAIVLGKANLSEWANWVSPNMPNGYSSLGGQVVAPYRFNLDPSGSSTGSGVSSTMAFATVAIGTETSGSIISPATTHSLVGLKPTLGLVSRSGVIPLAHSFDTAGPMARTVTDAAALLGVVAGADPADDASPAFVDSPLAGVVPDYLAALSDTALEGVRLGVREGDVTDSGLFGAALDVLEAQGAEIVPIDSEVAQLSAGSLLEIGAIFNEFKLFLNPYLAEETGPAVEVESLADVIALGMERPGRLAYGQEFLQLTDAQTGTAVDPLYLAARTGAITSSQTWIDTVLEQYDVAAIVGPNGANTSVTAAAGYPNVTVPMGYDGTTPRGIAFAGTAFTESDLLAYAFDYEQASRARIAPTVVNEDLRVPCPLGTGPTPTDDPGNILAGAGGATPTGAGGLVAASDRVLAATGGGGALGLGLLSGAALLAPRGRRR